MPSEQARYHLASPRGWINDPCAPSYDPSTGIYHVFYQWVKDGTEWAHAIGWGHATSTDMMHWEHESEPALWPEHDYESYGVYTGCALPGQAEMAVIYTCVNSKAKAAPVYVWGQEGLAIARSKDGGKAWIKDVENPLKIKPPPKITGWRDPIVQPWAAVDRVLGVSDGTYAMLSGGIVGEGPTLFLYSLDVAHPHDSWKDLGPLVRPEGRPGRPATPWTGDRGWNWECGGFFELDGASYIIVSSEGDWFEPFDGVQQGPKARKKPPKWQLWFRGRIEPGPKFVVEQEGVLDWGCYYAAQSFEHAPSCRRLFWGWNSDDDLTPAHRAKQGSTGVFSLPREFLTQKLNNVTKALRTPLDELPPFRVSASATVEGTYDIETLGFRPASEASLARVRAIDLADEIRQVRDSRLKLFNSRSFELSLSVEIEDTCEAFGLTVLDKVDISFLPSSERITVDKSKSTDDETINTVMASGAHTLFTRRDQGQEALELKVYVDGTLVEVYANDRFALSTRVYTDEGASGVEMFVKGSATVSRIECWEMGL